MLGPNVFEPNKSTGQVVSKDIIGWSVRYPGTYKQDLQKQRMFRFLTAASYQTTGRPVSGRTSAEPAWDEQ